MLTMVIGRQEEIMASAASHFGIRVVLQAFSAGGIGPDSSMSLKKIAKISGRILRRSARERHPETIPSEPAALEDWGRRSYWKSARL